MSRRAWAWGVPAAVLVLAALGFFYATSTPRYALYRLGVAMQRHDVAAAERYFDVERIADRAAEVIVADYLARQPEPTTTAEFDGRQLAASMAKRRVRPQVVTRVRLEIRRSVERAGVQADRPRAAGGSHRGPAGVRGLERRARRLGHLPRSQPGPGPLPDEPPGRPRLADQRVRPGMGAPPGAGGAGADPLGRAPRARPVTTFRSSRSPTSPSSDMIDSGMELHRGQRQRARARPP